MCIHTCFVKVWHSSNDNIHYQHENPLCYITAHNIYTYFIGMFGFFITNCTRGSGGVTKSFWESQLMHWHGQVLRNVFVIFQCHVCTSTAKSCCAMPDSYAPAMLNMFELLCLPYSSWPFIWHACIMHFKHMCTRINHKSISTHTHTHFIFDVTNHY